MAGKRDSILDNESANLQQPSQQQYQRSSTTEGNISDSELDIGGTAVNVQDESRTQLYSANNDDSKSQIRDSSALLSARIDDQGTHGQLATFMKQNSVMSNRFKNPISIAEIERRGFGQSSRVGEQTNQILSSQKKFGSGIGGLCSPGLREPCSPSDISFDP